MNKQTMKIFVIALLLPLIFLSGCTRDFQPQATTETETQATATVAINKTSPEPTLSPTLTPTPTETETVINRTPEEFLEILNDLYEKYDSPVSNIQPQETYRILSPNGRYLILRHGAIEDISAYQIFDIQKNQYVEIPINFFWDRRDMLGFYGWSLDGSTLLLQTTPLSRRDEDRTLVIIQSIDDRNFTEYVFQYPAFKVGYYQMFNQDNSRLIILGSTNYYSDFYVLDIEANLLDIITLPDEILPKDIYFFEENNFLIGYTFSDDDNNEISEIRIFDEQTEESEMVYRTSGKIDIIDYDPNRELLLVKKDYKLLYFIDTTTWTETTYLEEDVLFSQRTKLIGNCLPIIFEDEDGRLNDGLYNLKTGEIMSLGDLHYIGWYPLFENHLVLVPNGNGEYRIEFLNVACE